jgi:hypothetical protein
MTLLCWTHVRASGEANHHHDLFGRYSIELVDREAKDMAG